MNRGLRAIVLEGAEAQRKGIEREANPYVRPKPHGFTTAKRMFQAYRAAWWEGWDEQARAGPDRGGAA